MQLWATYPTKTYPDNKVHEANMGLIWGRQDPCGLHVGSMNFAIWVLALSLAVFLKNMSNFLFKLFQKSHCNL